MSHVLIPPERETFPNRIRWTVEECYQLADAGYLKGRYELIDGEILSKMGQNPPHRMTLILIADWLVSLFGKLYVQEQVPVRIQGEQGEYTEPEADVSVTKQPTTAYRKQHPSPDDLVLVVEVADSSLEFDLNSKALIYARAGVQEYWVADVTNRFLYIHRIPAFDGYQVRLEFNAESMVSIDSRPADLVSVSAFFPPLFST